MGIKGSKKVEKMYMKRHMYKKFGEVLYKCMRVKWHRSAKTHNDSLIGFEFESNLWASMQIVLPNTTDLYGFKFSKLYLDYLEAVAVWLISSLQVLSTPACSLRCLRIMFSCVPWIKKHAKKHENKLWCWQKKVLTEWVFTV